MMERWQYTKGLHDLGDGCYAYLQPDGSWGWSNAGLVTDGEESLLVDTLFDLNLTAEMLAAMRDANPAARAIDTLVNTHANGDHTFGNQIVDGARIVTTKLTADAMKEEGADQILGHMAEAYKFGDAGRFMNEIFSPFDFRGIKLPPVSETFTRELTLTVGDKSVHLLDVGPAHTASDLLVFVPQDKVVYTGDILFVGGHPAIWAGPVQNWVAACDRILNWDVETIVPGHGPICDKASVREFRAYLIWLEDEGRKRYDAGLTFEEAAHDIDLDRFAHWSDAERIVPNLMTLWAQFSGSRPNIEFLEIWAAMARYRAMRRDCLRGACANPSHQH